MRKAFVFVVCGDEVHIETLNFSLRYLKNFSQHEIIVVTDSQRNKASIHHEQILDVPTPQEYSNHQASIYLKTGLNRFLPKEGKYCYLDSDVIALNKSIDDIFDEYLPPIRFGIDHCTLNFFSPIAMNCSCTEKIEVATEEFATFLDENKEKFNCPKLDQKQGKLLQEEFAGIQSSPLKSIFYKLKYSLSGNVFKLNSNFYFNKEEKTWYNKQNTPVLYDIPLDHIIKKTQLSFDLDKNQWVNQYGNNFWNIECDHLIDAIDKDFKVNISQRDWQHWNGGVFLFDEQSESFMEFWHKSTLAIFDKPSWKIRDQGTLVMAAWKFGLAKSRPLDKKWNFLADDNNKKLRYNEDGYFSEDDWNTKHKVNFVHVYHRFGDETWDLWNYIKNIKIDE